MVQDGKVIENSVTNQPGMEDWDSITDAMCAEQKVVFQDYDDHANKVVTISCHANCSQLQLTLTVTRAG